MLTDSLPTNATSSFEMSRSRLSRALVPDRDDERALMGINAPRADERWRMLDKFFCSGLTHANTSHAVSAGQPHGRPQLVRKPSDWMAGSRPSFVQHGPTKTVFEIFARPDVSPNDILTLEDFRARLVHGAEGTAPPTNADLEVLCCEAVLMAQFLSPCMAGRGHSQLNLPLRLSGKTMDPGVEKDLLTLLSQVARLIRTYADQSARKHGITLAQWMILRQLELQPGLSQNELSAIADVAPITVARLVDRIEALGLVKRHADPKDRRVWRLRTTPAAAAALRDSERYFAKLDELIIKGVDPTALDAMVIGLRKMKDNLSSRGSLPTRRAGSVQMFRYRTDTRIPLEQ